MSPSPSFNSFSKSNLAEIAARVVEEFRVAEDGVLEGNFDDFFCKKRGPGVDISGSADEDEGEFEFASMSRENSEQLSTVSADEIFHNGKILPVYPTVKNSGSKIGPPLRKLFAEERKVFTSTSSAVDELEGAPAETYCVWRPKAAEEGRWKRSSFPGSLSKKWKIKDFLQRSFSVGSNRGRKGEEETIKEPNTRKEGLVFLSPSNGGRENVSSNVKCLRLITETAARSGGRTRLTGNIKWGSLLT